MRIVLSHFVHPDDALEREAANGAGGPYSCRAGPIGAWQPLPARCARDSRRHHPLSAEYDRGRRRRRVSALRGLVRSGVGFDNIDLAAWGGRALPSSTCPITAPPKSPTMRSR